MTLIQVKFTRSGVAGISRNDLREVGRRAMQAVAFHWWREFLPIHFTRRALQRYNYNPRSGDPGSGRPFKGSYAERKIKRAKNGQGVRAVGENKPYVWSGRSRERATSTPNITTRARNFREYAARISLNAPALNFVRDSTREFNASTVEEELALQDTFGTAFERALNDIGRTRQRTKTSN